MDYDYSVYMSDAIESLENERFIGSAPTFEMALDIVSSTVSGADNYWRFLGLESDMIAIDYGSWTNFVIIVGPSAADDLAAYFAHEPTFD